MKRVFFDENILRQSIATPERIEKAKENGRYFQRYDEIENVVVRGYKCDGMLYITDIVDELN